MVVPLGFGNLFDPVEFFRKSWSQLNLPAAFAPTMDVDELDRRIKDLKAVEQWLTVNMNMLRGSIQAMEVQRGTIAAINAFGKAISSPTPSEAAPTDTASSRAGSGRSETAGAEVRMPTPGAGQGLLPEDAAIEQARTGGSAGAAEAPAAPQSAQTPSAAPTADMPMLDPTAWWNMLQQQFQQVASSAMSGASLASLPGMGGLAALSSTLAGEDRAGGDAPDDATPRSKRRSPSKPRSTRASASESAAASGSPRKPAARSAKRAAR